MKGIGDAPKITEFYFNEGNILLVPVHRPNHWILFAAIRVSDALHIFAVDSMKDTFTADTITAHAGTNHVLVKDVVLWHLERSAKFVPSSIVTRQVSFPVLQDDQWSCGYYVCAAADMLTQLRIDPFETETLTFDIPQTVVRSVRVAMYHTYNLLPSDDQEKKLHNAARRTQSTKTPEKDTVGRLLVFSDSPHKSPAVALTSRQSILHNSLLESPFSFKR